MKAMEDAHPSKEERDELQDQCFHPPFRTVHIPSFLI